MQIYKSSALERVWKFILAICRGIPRLHFTPCLYLNLRGVNWGDTLQKTIFGHALVMDRKMGKKGNKDI